MSKGLQPYSTIGRVRAFFEANPDEVLTADDIQVKFRLDKARVARLLHVMRITGYLCPVTGTNPVQYARTGKPVNAAYWSPWRKRVLEVEA